ncbi:hypothetical protein ACIQV3_01400 [Streptomyces sp. NPDC099050]
MCIGPVGLLVEDYGSTAMLTSLAVLPGAPYGATDTKPDAC